MNCNDDFGPLSADPAIDRMLHAAPRRRELTATAIRLPGKLVNSWDFDEADPVGSACKSRVRPQQKLAFTLDNALSPEECAMLIATAEASGAYQPAGLGAAGKQTVSASLRSSDRLITDDKRLAELMWERVRDHVPVCFRGRRVLGLNEQLKFLRYQPGQFFKAHFDGAFLRPGTDNTTCITLQFYLSPGLEGGATRFVAALPRELRTGHAALPAGLQDADCEARQGRALLFQHDILHEGATVERGIKYTVRADIEYGPCRWDHSLREDLGLGGSPLQTRRRLLGCALLVATTAAALWARYGRR